MARDYVTVTLTARVSGDYVVLLDAHGKKIARVPLSVAHTASQSVLESISIKQKWKASFGGMIHFLSQRNKRLSATEWERKIATWQKSLRLRRNRPHVFKAQSRRFSPDVRKTWDDAIRCLMSQYLSARNEYLLRKKNPWRLWAQTVSGNHRKKTNAGQDRTISDSETIAAKTGRTEFQVCFDWSNSDSSVVVA